MNYKRTLKKITVVLLIAILAFTAVLDNGYYVHADSANDFDEVPYWRFDAGGEKQKIMLYTENIPNTLSFAGFADDTAARLNNTGSFRNENEGDLSALYRSDNYLEYTINYEGNAILVPAQSISYKKNLAGNEVYLEEPVNDKLQYAIESTKAKEGKYKWMICENIIRVPVTATYTYKQFEFVKSEDDLLYNVTVGTRRYDAEGRYSYTSWDNYIYDSLFSVISSLNSKYITHYDSYYTSFNGITLAQKYPVNVTEKTITFTDYIDFYIIDTNLIKDKGENVNVHIKNLVHPKYVTENYSFVEEKSSLRVKYTVSDGFTVSGLAKGKEWVGWINSSSPVQTQNGGDRALLWKTKSETMWHLTFPDTINGDIPVNAYMSDGTTLYFMDANCSTKIVTVKIPKRGKMPELNLSVESFDSVISSLKADSTMFRAYTIGDDGSVNYIEAPSTFATAQYDNWYLFKGNEDYKKGFTLNALLGYADNKDERAIPGLYIEAKTQGTNTKMESLVSVFYVNEQQVFGSWASANDPVKVSLTNGILEISDADKYTMYEYMIEGTDKWKKVSKAKTVDEKITADSVVFVRKASSKTPDKTVILPSTYIEVRDGVTKVFTAPTPTP